MRIKIIFAFAIALMVVNVTLAQDQTVQNSSNIGMPPNGVFSGSDFESVQLQNGNLHIDIPIWSQKGRGLGTGSKFIYDSLGWTSSPPHCDHTSGVCSNHITTIPDNSLSLRITSPFGYVAGAPLGRGGPSPCTAVVEHSNYTLREPDGTKHHFLPDPAQSGGSTGAACGGPLGRMYADDGSGWIMNVDPSTGALISAVSKDGTRITWPQGTSSNGVEVRDSNGNYLYYPPDGTTGTGTDTLGRTVYTDGSYVDSSGTHQLVTIATEAVTIQTNLCQYLGADTCGEYSSTWNVPHVITLPNNMTYTINYVQGQYGQPSSMTLPTGGQISWTWYQPSGNKSTFGPMVQQRTLTANGQSGTWQYSAEGGASVTVTDPAGNQTVSAFTCPTGRYVDTNMNSGEFDPPCYVSSAKYYQGSSSTGTLLKTVATAYTASGAMLPQTVTTTLNDANLVSKTYTTYDSIPIPLWTSDNFTWGNPTEHDEYDYGTGAAGALVRKTTTNYLHLTNSTYQTANIADKSTVKNTFDVNGTLVAETQLFYDDPGGYMVADLGNPPNHDSSFSTSYLTRGNPTRVQRWLIPGSSWLTTNNYYDDLGNLRQTYDPGNHVTTYSYTDNFTVSAPSCVPTGYKAQAFASVVTNALSQISATGYFGCTGLPAWKQDQNDINASRYGAQFTYDLMNRPLTATYADGGQTAYTYVDTVSSTSPNVLRQDLIVSGTQTSSYTLVDGLGRVNRTARANGEGSPNIYDQVDTCYDALGHKSFERYPFQGPGWGTSVACSNSANTPGDAFLYDALDRPTQITNTDGSVVTTAYWGNWTTVTDQAGRKRKSKTDALGRLVEVCEADPVTGALPTQGTCTYETDYQYDVLDDLTRVDQKGNDPNSANWRTRWFTYDSLGRLLTANNPETGVISYGYDADSNMTSKTAPNVNGGTGTITTTYSYDALHRLGYKSYSNSSDAVSYHYDETAPWGVTLYNTIGRLSQADSHKGGLPSNAEVASTFSYDSMGRVITQATTNQRASNGTIPLQTLNYTYNLDGSLNTEQYPSGRTITYTYNQGQRALSAVDTANAINYVTSATYAAWGALAGAVYGHTASFNGITLSNSFNNRMQPAFITASTPTNTVLSLGYDFHLGNGTSGSDNGNVMGITNNRDTTRSQTFTYDYLNRLTSASTTSTLWGNNYSYDLWGNMWQKVIMSGKNGGENLSSSVDKLTNRLNGYGYDAAGNMTTNGSATWNYDAENRLISAPGITFDYDAEGRRVQKSDGKLYWYGQNDEILAETNLSGALQEEFVFFNGERVARRDAATGNVHYYFSDFLHSTDMVTDALGTMSTCPGTSVVSGEEESDFYPFGGERVICDRGIGNNYKFTGKERDPETGLDDFEARYYSSALGRFVTPDWAAAPTSVPYADFGNPQSLNLYLYVKNNPETFTDPNGHDPCSCFPSTEAVNRVAGDIRSFGSTVWTVLKQDAATLQNLTTKTLDTLQRAGFGAEAGIDPIRFHQVSSEGAAGQEAQEGADGAKSGGRLGSPETRALDKTVAEGLEKEGYTVTHGAGKPQEYIPGPGGARKGSTYPDVTGTKDGETVRVNTATTRADGQTLTKAEQQQVNKINAARPNDQLRIVPKPKKSKD